MAKTYSIHFGRQYCDIGKCSVVLQMEDISYCVDTGDLPHPPQQFFFITFYFIGRESNGKYVVTTKHCV